MLLLLSMLFISSLMLLLLLLLLALCCEGVRLCSKLCSLLQRVLQLLGHHSQRVLTSLLNLLTNRVAGVDIHRIRAHKDRVALREVVGDDGRLLRSKDIARLLPIFAPIGKDYHLLRGVVYLDIVAQQDIVAVTIVVHRVTQHLLLLGQHIAVECQFVELLGLVE